MQSDALEILRNANEHLRSALIRFQPAHQISSAITPEDFAELRSHVRQGAECQSGLPMPYEPGSTLERESREYQRNVENLKFLLPDIQVRLLAEKARLERARAHMEAAEAWARSRK